MKGFSNCDLLKLLLKFFLAKLAPDSHILFYYLKLVNSIFFKACLLVSFVRYIFSSIRLIGQLRSVLFPSPEAPVMATIPFVRVRFKLLNNYFLKLNEMF
jgi:hypothetical protein